MQKENVLSTAAATMSNRWWHQRNDCNLIKVAVVAILIGKVTNEIGLGQNLQIACREILALVLDLLGCLSPYVLMSPCIPGRCLSVCNVCSET